MKTETSAYRSHLPPQNSKILGAGKLPPATEKSQHEILDKDKKHSADPDYKLDLSLAPPLPSLPTPPSASTPDIASQNNSRPSEGETKPEAIKDEIKKSDLKKVSEVREISIKEGSQKKPAIVFIKGLDIFSSPLTSEGRYDGVGKMCEAVEGARLYGWNQKKEIIHEIKKVHKDWPVILVGHSFGGDTAVEVANELNSLEHGFRKVDLLVTLDAVGMNNDTIPQNVKNHLNIFGENNFFLNDGPHVARRNELTQVKNVLTHLDHTELDDNKEIQFEIIHLIKEILPQDTESIT